MRDSYRPANRDRYRSDETYYQDSEASDQYAYDEYDEDRRRRRSRSPPRRRFEYDEGREYRRRDYDGRTENVQDGFPDPPANPRQRPRGLFSNRVSGMMHTYNQSLAPPPDSTGENDASDEQKNKFVLVRDLKEIVSKETFAKGLEKLYRSNDSTETNANIGAEPGTLRRVLLICDREQLTSMGYGFAEYFTAADAAAAVAKAKSLGEMSTISSKRFTVAFAHNGIFHPAELGSTVEYNPMFTIKLLGRGQMHKYRDERYYAQELMVNELPEESLFAILPHTTNDGKDKQAKKQPQHGKETLENKSKKRKAPGSAPAMPAIVGHFQRKQAEARGEEAGAQNTSTAQQQPATGVNAIVGIKDDTAAVAQSFSDEQTFAHNGPRVACYLCNTQFTSKDSILRHLRDSAKHSQNLRDDKMVEAGYTRLKHLGIEPNTTIKLPKPEAAADTNQMEGVEQSGQGKKGYMDRAKKRRQEEAQTGISVGPNAGAAGATATKVGFSLKNRGNKSTASSPPSSDNETGKYGKGLGMLQKAGWSEGQGLGAGRGTGISAPLEQAMYAQGVGLGHESSKQGDAVAEADRMTRGDGSGFLEKTKEGARRRYEGM